MGNKGHKSRHHVNPLGSAYLTPSAAPVALPTGDIEVELGCADARFLFERAPQHPTTHFLGLEIRRPMVEQVNADAEKLGLGNLSAWFSNITVDLDVMFDDGRLARAFVNFPDPWFKRRHHKRRLMTVDLAETIARKLRPGGQLFFQSDVFDLALDALAALEEVPALVNQREPWSFWPDNPFGAKSLREVRCEQRSKRIWRSLFVKA